MKEMGIVRRVDQLGRIVLPIEMRRVHKIEEGTLLEIVNTKESIMLKNYSPVGQSNHLANLLVESFSGRAEIIVTDREQVIAGKKRGAKLVGSSISERLKCRDTFEWSIPIGIDYDVTALGNSYNYYIINIVKDGDKFGFVILFDTEEILTDEIKIAKVSATILANNC